jgi:hypothetical protein
MSLSNLPPGVTDAMIDAHFGPGECGECEDGNHAECEQGECRCDVCEEDARADAEEMRAEARREARMFGDD